MISSQAPRPLSRLDLEKVLTTSRKTRVAATEYTLNSQSSGWSRNNESNDYQVQAAISELSRLVVSQIMNIQSEPDTQDPWDLSSVPQLPWDNILFCNIMPRKSILFYFLSFLKYLFIDVLQIDYTVLSRQPSTWAMIFGPLTYSWLHKNFHSNACLLHSASNIYHTI